MLAREGEAGASRIWNVVSMLIVLVFTCLMFVSFYGCVPQIVTTKDFFQGKGALMLLSVAEDPNQSLEMSVCAIRIVDELLKNHARVSPLQILELFDLFFCEF